MEQVDEIDIIKQHLRRIHEEESKKYKEPPELLIFNKDEYLEYVNFFKKIGKKYNLICDNSILHKLANSLKKVDFINSKYFVKTSGCTDGRDIKIFLKEDDVEYSMFYKFKTIYHEFKHIEQREKRKAKHILESYITDFDTFRNLIEHECHVNVSLSYKLLYDGFYSEIESNIYGSEMAYRYCLENHIFDYGIAKDDYKREHLKGITYDFDKFLSLYNNFGVKVSYRKTTKDSTYGIFFDKNGKCRKLSQITSNPLFYGLDDMLKKEILTSRTFLSSINYKLNDIEKNYISELVSGKIKDLTQAYLTVQERYSDSLISDDDYLKYQFNLLSRIGYLTNSNICLKDIKYDKKESLNKLISEINSIEGHIQYENINGSRPLASQFYKFDRDVIKNIVILNRLMINNAETNNYSEMMSSITLLNETMKQIMDRQDMDLNAEYEQITAGKEGKKR